MVRGIKSVGAVALVVVVSVVGCTGSAATASPTQAPTPTDRPVTPHTLTLTSPDFASSDGLPDANSCIGAGASPALAWTGVPDGTKQLVVVMKDITRGTLHWVAYLPMASGSLPANASRSDRGFKEPFSYMAPCAHHGHSSGIMITIYALSDTVQFTAPSMVIEVEEAIGDKAIDSADMMATVSPSV